jgi:putative flippase GtrA
MKNVFVVIPTLNPEAKVFLPFMDELIKNFNYVIVVNDGSSKKFDSVFAKLDKKIVVLKHYINMGKGRAMKTAINYILNSYEDIDSIVTADSDGQHTIKDITACAKESINNQKAYVLGCRNIKGKNVPFKSKYGNLITRNIMRLFIGLNISDTQTGLRAMSREVATKFLTTKGERYEYETNTLIECKTDSIPILEVPIETIYINNNKASHFNPFKDGLSIYKLFFKYIFASISSFLVDIVLFALFLGLIKDVNAAFISTVLARIISSIYNFLVNSKLVFKHISKKAFIKYALLVIIQMFMSAFIVNFLGKKLAINLVVIKVVVDIIIFMVNFVVQREFVFKESK